MHILASAADSVRATTTPWQQAMRTAVRDGEELCQRLGLPPELGRESREAAEGGRPPFPVFVPLGYLAKIRPGDPDDPLLRQVLPRRQEGEAVPGFVPDPVGDLAARRAAGLLQKYPGRALLVTTGACAVHCRYCFRRHFPYHEGSFHADSYQTALLDLAADPTVEEVILSGGDPLTLADSQLARLSARLAEVPHLRRMRVHTRLPVVIPERVTAELIEWLRGTRLTPLVVVHANHPREVDDEVGAACSALVDAGIPVLNQSVLLRGVNDDSQTLIALSRRLIELRVLPYYLHQLDRVAGAAHFEVPEHRGRELIDQLRAQLPGYAVPRYVREQSGEPSKTSLS